MSFLIILKLVLLDSGYFPQINASADRIRSSPLYRQHSRSSEWLYFWCDRQLGDMGLGCHLWPGETGKAILEESKVTLDDDVRQVELEVQQAFANVLQGRELIKATEKSVEQAAEALRLATARLMQAPAPSLKSSMRARS